MSAAHFYCVFCGTAQQIPAGSQRPLLWEITSGGRNTPLSDRLTAPISLEEEIDFLRGGEPGKPEAAV